MEFKGTKGKWYITKDNNVFSDGKMIFAHQSNFNNEETKANALLISKAPEMLEMLELILNEKGLEQIVHANLIHNAKQLIKEATEL